MKSEINITPLVDVVLVLLIIFMVVTPMLQTGYDVRVPPRSDGPSPSEAQIVVRQTGADHFYINNEPVSRVELRQRLTGILKRNHRTVFFDAADDLNYGSAVATLDLLHECGAANLGIVTGTTQPQ